MARKFHKVKDSKYGRFPRIIAEVSFTYTDLFGDVVSHHIKSVPLRPEKAAHWAERAEGHFRYLAKQEIAAQQKADSDD
jgi:hypothetical protein